MKDFIFCLSVVLVSLPKDDASIISCNMERLSWQDAVKSCKSKNGSMLSFNTGLGQNTDQLGLKSENDVWTADYFITSQSGTEEYCGFNYLNSTLYDNKDVFYGDCNANRNYFCKSETGWLVINNSTRENIRCPYFVSTDDLRNMSSTIKSGFYWTSGRENGTVGTDTEQFIALKTSRYRKFCGAYKSTIGRYFAAWDMKRGSLCSNNRFDTNDEICFDGQTTSVNKHITYVNRLELTTRTSHSEAITGRTVSTIKHQMISLVIDKTVLKQMHSQDEQKTLDIGIKVGVPLGIVLPLICGILIVTYIYRKRIKCWQSSDSTAETRRINQFRAQENPPIHGSSNVYSESIQDTSILSEHQTNRNNNTDISALYAVVKQPKKGATKSTIVNTSNETFQNETINNYDVSSRFQNHIPKQSDNLYSHLESDEYNTASFARREGESFSMYNTTGERNLVESAYDSTNHMSGTAASPGCIYSHLSQDQKYFDSKKNSGN